MRAPDERPQTSAKRLKEQATDTLQTTYRAAPRDFAALAQRVQAGDTLYTQTDTGTRRWTVTDQPSAISKAPMVTPADAHDQTPLISLQQLLARCRVIYTQPPDQT
ncbi:hypothetical protein [Streptomyces lateritius]|uniref:hypothetical protein n=1 Tax=Streptomyces lateritius TaxID=67313 RepID=UPI001C8BB30B|nr:hypothetical protein [Streptomyces lateritius]MBX9425444.1 hypothetical protein [Streptomyces lateritius]